MAQIPLQIRDQTPKTRGQLVINLTHPAAYLWTELSPREQRSPGHGHHRKITFSDTYFRDLSTGNEVVWIYR
jgi:hypothetical protein